MFIYDVMKKFRSVKNNKRKIALVGLLTICVDASADSFSITTNSNLAVNGTAYDIVNLAIPIPAGTVVNVSGFVQAGCTTDGLQKSCVPIAMVSSGSDRIRADFQATSGSTSFSGALVSNGLVHLKSEAITYYRAPAANGCSAPIQKTEAIQVFVRVKDENGNSVERNVGPRFQGEPDYGIPTPCVLPFEPLPISSTSSVSISW